MSELIKQREYDKYRWYDYIWYPINTGNVKHDRPTNTAQLHWWIGCGFPAIWVCIDVYNVFCVIISWIMWIISITPIIINEWIINIGTICPLEYTIIISIQSYPTKIALCVPAVTQPAAGKGFAVNASPITGPRQRCPDVSSHRISRRPMTEA